MKRLYVLLVLVVLVFSCRKDPVNTIADITAYNFDYPERFKKFLPPIEIPSNNQMSVEGVALGRLLFYEKLLSGDNTQSCATCHSPENAFSDTVDFSIGIDGFYGTRNSMPLINLGWMKTFFWNGRKPTIEDQVFAPVTDPLEMHENWSNAVDKLQTTDKYPPLFEQIFKTKIIDSTMVAKVIAQFERTLISGNTPMDKYMNANFAIGSSGWSELDEFAAYQGFSIFMDESKGDCFHCHGDLYNPLWTDNLYHNNGLDAIFTDRGLGEFTENAADDGKFKTPTLRNLVFTAPYMHDGRFKTLDEVINHYSEGLMHSSTIDPLMKSLDDGGVNITAEEKYFLKMFLISLSDSSFVKDKRFTDPN